MKHAVLITTFTAVFLLTFTVPVTLFADGNVLAYYELDDYGTKTALVILGDNEDNHIRVTVDDVDHMVIDGLDGTTVNGLPSDELSFGVAFPNPIPVASIDLGNGDDTLEHLFTSWSEHSTNIVTGNGHDSVSISELASRTGQIRVNTGVGDDDVSLYFAASGVYSGYFEITTGFGRDSVIVEEDNDDLGFHVLDRFGIETNEGDDSVFLKGDYYSLYGRLSHVEMGSGNDLLIGDPDINASPFFELDASGDLGHDTVLNASYFEFYRLFSFETIEP